MTQKNINHQVRQIIARVAKQGDHALIIYAKKFDGITLASKDLKVPKIELKKAYQRLSPQVRSALLTAKRNIERFHQSEFKSIKNNWMISSNQLSVGQKSNPIETVGLYIPGGRFPYPSTVLMTAIPAKIAGVKKLVLTTPKKNLGDETLAAAYLCGIDPVFTVGGPAGIAALAFGTKTIPKVDKIVGPGNRYVTEAKRQLYGTVGIDGLAGPSEVVVWADSSSDPRMVLLNLLSQAEHDPSSRSILLGIQSVFLKKIMSEIPQKLKPQISMESFRSDSAVLNRINEIAPEHLVLAIKNPAGILNKIKNAGAIFVGRDSPVPLGDYTAGPSHVLPTGSTAKFSSGLSVKDFLKWSSVIINKKKINNPSIRAARTLAQSEGLKYHALCLKILEETGSIS